MKSVIQVQILDKAVCDSLRSNPLGKGINLSVLPQVEQNRFFSFGKATSLEGKPIVFHLKIELVPHPA